MVEFIDRDQAVIEGGRALILGDFIEGEAEGGMGADQHTVVRGHEFLDGLHFAASCTFLRSVQAEVPACLHLPVGEEAVAGQIGRAFRPAMYWPAL